MASIGQRLRRLRLARGVTQQGLAAAVGVTQVAVSRWEADAIAPEREKLARLAEQLGVPPAHLEYGGPEIENEVDWARARPMPPMPRDLPVYGAARGSFGGEEVRVDAAIGFAPRPPHLATVREAAAVAISGESMEPRYHPGEIAYIHPHLPARAGDYVMIEFRDHTAIVKRLVRIGPDYVEVAQLNPAGRRKLPRATIAGIYRIVGSAPGDAY